MDGVQAVIVATLVVGVVVTAILMMRWVRTAAEGTALIVSGSQGKRVAFDRVVAVPGIHRVEVIDLGVHAVVVDRRGRDGLHCNDNIRADVRATFHVRVNRTTEDILKVAQTVGCARASDPAALAELFVAKFTEALRAVVRMYRFEEGLRDGMELKDRVIESIGRDLNGFMLDEVAIDTFAQTPIEQLDPNNILDAEGIRKITEVTAEQKMRANEVAMRMRKETSRQQLEADEAVWRIEQERAELAARRK
jgi:uncharacterized membrane protein YqiK